MYWKPFLLGILFFAVSIFLIMFTVGIATGSIDGHEEYQYTIKTEQVNEDEMVEQHTDMENLTEEQQDILFRAFKKTDHFFGSASITVATDERVKTFDSWLVIEVKGVPLLVAVEGPIVTGKIGPIGKFVVSTMFGSFGFLFLLASLACIADGIQERKASHF